MLGSLIAYTLFNTYKLYAVFLCLLVLLCFMPLLIWLDIINIHELFFLSRVLLPSTSSNIIINSNQSH